MMKFLKNSKAATAIEFAIIAPVFFLIFLGIVEIGLTVFFDSSLNTGMRTAARYGVANGIDSKGQIEEILNTNLGGLYRPDKGRIVTLSFTDFDNQFTNVSEAFRKDPKGFFDNAQPGTFEPDAANKNTLQSGKVVIYGVRYEWGGFTKLLSPFIPKYLYAITVVRNESYTPTP